MSTKTRFDLRTGTSVAQFIDGVISESIKSALHQKSLQEKEKQAAAAGSQGNADNSGDGNGGDTDLFGDDNSGGDQEAGTDGSAKPAPSKTMDAEVEKLKNGDVEPADVVDKLNTIRSGKSFKDDRVSAAMEEYVGSLSKAEKTALLAFLKGIAQIVTGEIPGNNALEPDDDPSLVSMKKGPEKAKTKHIEPNVITGQAPKKKSPSTEDTSAPVPIIPKK